jgi:hypothetical protein
VPSKDPQTRTTVARIAAYSRAGRTPPPEVLQDQRELELRRVESSIRRLVSTAAELSPEQRSRLALLLRGPSDPGGAAG